MQLECRNYRALKLPFSTQIVEAKLVVMQPFASFSLTILELYSGPEPICNS